MKYKQIELNFTSLGRSGHHAIIFWILNNLGGVEEMDPAMYFANNTLKIHYFNIASRNLLCNTKCPITFNYLLKSYEDTVTVDSSNIIIIRDFLNLVCSRYERGFGRWGVLGYQNYFKKLEDFFNAWKMHARIILRDGSHKHIMYNRWLLEKKYRDDVSESIGIKNIIDNIDYVPGAMYGFSSFIGGNKEQDLNRYLKRHEQVELPKYLINPILEDIELLDLNKQLFNIDIKKILTQ